MDTATFKRLVDATHLKCYDTLFNKGLEYQNANAGEDEVLANFYRGSQLTDVIPEKVLFIYLSKHYESISNFIKNIDKDGLSNALLKSSEPIDMRIVDMINYCYLLLGLIKDRMRLEVTKFPNQPSLENNKDSSLI